jgi:L-cysteine S-thiosulfotransferase
MKTYTAVSFLLFLLLAVTGCDVRAKSGRGFMFPRGDALQGKAAFVRLECYTCHRVAGETSLPSPTVDADKVIVLGGEVIRLRSYGDLVTAVIHPSASLSEKLVGSPRLQAEQIRKSPMPVKNDQMSVTEMLDLVTFLHPHYQKLEQLFAGYYGP